MNKKDNKSCGWCTIEVGQGYNNKPSVYYYLELSILAQIYNRISLAYIDYFSIVDSILSVDSNYYPR